MLSFTHQARKVRMHPSFTLLLHRLTPGPLPRAKSTPTLLLRSLLSNCSSLGPQLLLPHRQSPKNKKSRPKIAMPVLLASLQDTQSQCPVAMQPPLVYPSSHRLTPHPSSFDTSPWMRMVKYTLQSKRMITIIKM